VETIGLLYELLTLCSIVSRCSSIIFTSYFCPSFLSVFVRLYGEVKIVSIYYGCVRVCIRQPEMTDFMLVHPNTVSVLYQIPQYILITAGEILFSIPGLSFAYSQVPAAITVSERDR